MTRTKIVLAGEGGQGVQSMAKILIEAGYEAGKEVIYIPNFGVEQRGGVSIAFCQISDTKIGEPRFSKADLVVLLSDRAIDRCATYVDENTTVVYDSSVCTRTPEFKAKRIIGVDANKIANDELSTRVFNVIIVGVVLSATNIVEVSDVKNAMELELGKKFEAKPELRDLNYKALERGMNLLEKVGA
ncbi:2-oxoglutarate ferredoxin oxidoreductase subunit gamma [Candidatus Gastranaerophilus sp. (ex Termes propinquus)]|nr:2-oxoglutarate ferredoxin oxidoreductase subunit gamma [Candidatus Gastranaerophilus sp. (ex Termes propinquus)]